MEPEPLGVGDLFQEGPMIHIPLNHVIIRDGYLIMPIRPTA
jgi:hypothetical protein